MFSVRRNVKLANSIVDDVRDYAIFMIDADNKIATWNTGAERVLGYRENEVMGTDFLVFYPSTAVRKRIVSFLRMETQEDRIELEDWCVRKGNVKFWAVISIGRLLDDSGERKGHSVIIHDLTERKIVEEQLKESEVQLRSLAARLQAVREEERTRIARELHDEFGQMLTALRMDLSILERMVSKTITEPLARISLFEKIAAISELLEKTIRATRRIITELRPAVLDELGLLTAIQWQALEFENRTGVRCRIARLQHDIVLDQNSSTAVFRILQEALTNVAKHATATSVTISLQISGDNMVMEISDNGKGMGEEKQKDPMSTGILGIRERILALDGIFEIHSKRGEGTMLKISIPYKPPARHR